MINIINILNIFSKEYRNSHTISGLEGDGLSQFIASQYRETILDSLREILNRTITRKKHKLYYLKEKLYKVFSQATKNCFMCVCRDDLIATLQSISPSFSKEDVLKELNEYFDLDLEKEFKKFIEEK